MLKVNATEKYIELIMYAAQHAGMDIFYCDTLELHETEWGLHHVPEGCMPCFKNWGNTWYCNY